jgi:hypothetical protein
MACGWVHRGLPSPPRHDCRHGSIPPHAGGRRRHETRVLEPRERPLLASCERRPGTHWPRAVGVLPPHQVAGALEGQPSARMECRGWLASGPQLHRCGTRRFNDGVGRATLRIHKQDMDGQPVWPHVGLAGDRLDPPCLGRRRRAAGRAAGALNRRKGKGVFKALRGELGYQIGDKLI